MDRVVHNVIRIGIDVSLVLLGRRESQHRDVWLRRGILPDG
jgi:hypothetical protein